MPQTAQTGRCLQDETTISRHFDDDIEMHFKPHGTCCPLHVKLKPPLESSVCFVIIVLESIGQISFSVAAEELCIYQVRGDLLS